MTIISDIKPSSSEGKTRPKPNMEWNNRTYESYIENGFTFDEFDRPSFNRQEMNFLSEVDERQGAIVRQVTRIVRLKAIDWSTQKRERKEYLYYFENWYGKNWLGLKIAPVTDHIEGMFYEQLKELKLDARSGEAIHYARSGQRESYYIPFSKKTVDQIIAGPAHSKESIKFIVKFASEDSPAGQMRAATRG